MVAGAIVVGGHVIVLSTISWRPDGLLALFVSSTVFSRSCRASKPTAVESQAIFVTRNALGLGQSSITEGLRKSRLLHGMEAERQIAAESRMSWYRDVVSARGFPRRMDRKQVILKRLKVFSAATMPCTLDYLPPCSQPFDMC